MNCKKLKYICSRNVRFGYFLQPRFLYLHSSCFHFYLFFHKFLNPLNYAMAFRNHKFISYCCSCVVSLILFQLFFLFCCDEQNNKNSFSIFCWYLTLDWIEIGIEPKRKTNNEKNNNKKREKQLFDLLSLLSIFFFSLSLSSPFFYLYLSMTNLHYTHSNYHRRQLYVNPKKNTKFVSLLLRLLLSIFKLETAPKNN